MIIKIQYHLGIRATIDVKKSKSSFDLNKYRTKAPKTREEAIAME